MTKTNPFRRKGALTWNFIRALIRIYIAYVQAHLCVGAKVPDWLVNMLPAAERITSGMLWAMLVAPDVLEKIRLDRKTAPKAKRPYDPLIISDADLRRRIARIKAILDDPREETARLKAIADQRGIKCAMRAGQRPVNFLEDPHTDDLWHAVPCLAQNRRAGFSPPSRAPPFAVPIVTAFATGEARRFCGRSCWRAGITICRPLQLGGFRGYPCASPATGIDFMRNERGLSTCSTKRSKSAASPARSARRFPASIFPVTSAPIRLRTSATRWWPIR